jgi:hypothetical protein
MVAATAYCPRNLNTIAATMLPGMKSRLFIFFQSHLCLFGAKLIKVKGDAHLSYSVTSSLCGHPRAGKRSARPDNVFLP